MMPDSTQNGEKSSVRSSGSKRRSDDKQQPKSDKKSSKQRASSSASIKTQQPTSRQKQEIHPIEHYADSPAQMIDQLFQTVQGEELTVLLPSILKNVPVEELKALCLKQLQQMTKEDIIKIVTGTEESTDKCSAPPLPDSTSTESDASSITRPKVEGSVEVVAQTTTASTGLRITPTLPSVASARKQGTVSTPGLKPSSVADNESNSDLSSSLTKMQMEILELELRARAIKALLRSQGMTDDKDEEMDTGEKHPKPKTKQ